MRRMLKYKKKERSIILRNPVRDKKFRSFTIFELLFVSVFCIFSSMKEYYKLSSYTFQFFQLYRIFELFSVWKSFSTLFFYSSYSITLLNFEVIHLQHKSETQLLLFISVSFLFLPRNFAFCNSFRIHVSLYKWSCSMKRMSSLPSEMQI
jgi:hypothetical protein